MLRVMLACHSLINDQTPDLLESEPFALEPSDDLTDQSAGYAVRLDHYECVFV